MNTNEVLANRAAEILGGARGDYSRVHPNDHVNMGQSTNDVFPTATRLALLAMMPGPSWPRARPGRRRCARKAREFDGVLKTGRTHLQDAVPMTLGQEFGGFAANIAHARQGGRAQREAAARAEPRFDRGRHRAQRRQRLHGGARRATLPALYRSAASGLRSTASASRRAWATCSATRAPCGGWPPKSARSPPICGSSAWDRAPALPRSSCRPCSRGRRSCRARSTRQCPRWSTRSASRSSAATPRSWRPPKPGSWS